MKQFARALTPWMLILLIGCATTVAPPAVPPDADTAEAGGTANPHPVFLGTLWIQTSAEYGGVSRQAFRAAAVSLEEALADTSWTAAVEQEGADYSDLPPAIITDVDETVLDNAAYEAQLAVTGTQFTDPTWDAWVLKEKAVAVPGAREFLKLAEQKGVAIFYVTNRSAATEKATRSNLIKEGFPFDDSRDSLLTKGENGWGSDKITRRQEVAKTHRIVMLMGDDLNDFVSGARAEDPETRNKLAEQYEDRWGERWIVLPNPLYGSWLASLFGRDYSLSEAEKQERMREHLILP